MSISTGTQKRFVAAVTAALTLVLATSASAQNPFVIDGAVPANGTLTGPAQTADPFGSVRELGPVNGSNTKVGVIHTATPPMLEFTNPNGQVDLRNIWTQTVNAANGDIWFYFAWERDANTGSGFIAYEFQQAALSPACVYAAAGINMILPQSAAETALINTCNPWAGRRAGDFLIMWDQSGNALTITKRVFALSGGQLVLGPNQVLGSAVAAISGDGVKGEAAIDLTADVFPAAQCVNFANIIPGTVTGNSDTADYKDTVLALYSPVSNCGIVTVTKVTQPAGGTGTFPYTLQRADGSAIGFDGTLAIDQTLTHDGDSAGSPILNLKEGDNYTLTEAPSASPWEQLSIACTVGGGTPIDLTNGGTFTVEASTTTACTITNRQRRGSIRVIKQVVNDNGGTAVASDFTIALGDSANTTFAGVANPGTTYSFDEGYTFSVTEIGLPAGYAQISASGDCSGAIAADVTKVCAITNDDIAPRLTVVKHVINDNGGKATAGQWTMNVSATNPSASSFPGAESPGTTTTLNAGAFTVTESGGPGGYLQTGAVGCAGTIALGETKTCTITNDDGAPSLTLIKTVINNNGGTAVATAFTLSAAGPTPISGAGGATSNATLSAGSYALTETSGAGYTAGAWVCTGTGTQTGNSIALANGQAATCTITNDDNAPSLTLVKTVINNNGGTAAATAFTLSAAGPTPISGAGGATSSATFSAGSYALSETSLAGYTAGAWVCTGTQTGSSIALANGQAATCAITNDDERAAPSGATVQGVVLHDTLTITGIRVGAPGAAATVTFRLYSDASCTMLVGAEGPVPISLSGTTGTATTVVGVGPVSASGGYFWTAQYTGNQFNTAFTTSCGAEQTTVNFQQ